MDLIIRKAEIADAADIAEIHMRSWEAAYADIIPKEAIAEKNAKRPSMWEKILSDKNDVYIALIGDKPFGLLSILDNNDEDVPGAGGIGGIYLHPDYYGKGYGKKVMDFAVKALKDKGISTITLWVLEENTRARKFYEKYGFSFDGTKKEIVIGKPLVEIRYVLHILNMRMTSKEIEKQQAGLIANELLLIKPSKNLEDLIWEYRGEYFKYGETNINGSCGLAHYENFDEWLELTLSIEKERLRNNVHASTFFSIRKSDNRIIGSIQLRHSLTPELEQHGGHIGYGIRPSERKKGYGKQQLTLVLDVAKQMEIRKVLITCEKDNIASAKTAISCGGKLAGENIHENKPQLLFWIEI